MRPTLTTEKDLGCSQYFASDSSATTTTTAASVTTQAATATTAATSLLSTDSTITTAATTTATTTSLRTTTISDDDNILHAINRPLHINDVGPLYLRKGGAGFEPSPSPSFEPTTLPPSILSPSTLPPGGLPSPTNAGDGSGNGLAPTFSPSPSLIDGGGGTEDVMDGNVTHIARVHRTDAIPVGLDTSEVAQMVRHIHTVNNSLCI